MDNHNAPVVVTVYVLTCKGQRHARGLGKGRLRLSFLREGVLVRGHVHDRLQCCLLLKLLQLLLASFLHICACVPDALLPGVFTTRVCRLVSRSSCIHDMISA